MKHYRNLYGTDKTLRCPPLYQLLQCSRSTVVASGRFDASVIRENCPVAGCGLLQALVADLLLR
jgi:hypothetical protein